ncbi:MAG: DMT family transporter [Nitrospinae bacterium]|nr:DMT family transporter [Nitrospinota bacterium]
MAGESDQSTGPGNSLLGALAVLIAAVSFSGKAVLVKLAYRHGVDATTLLALRMLMALPFFAALAVWGEWKSERKTTPRELGMIAGIGLLGFYLAALTDFVGLQYISAGLERLILFLYPTMVVLISASFLKRPITGTDVISLLLSSAGVGLAVFHDISFVGGQVWLGVALILTSALAYAFYLVVGGELIKKAGSARFTAYAMLSSAAAITAHFLLMRPLSAFVQPPPVYQLTAVMAFFSTVIPAFLMSEGMKRIGASRSSIINSIGPVSTIALAWYFLGEQVSMAQAGGTVLVIAGVLLTTLRRGK